MYRGVIDLRSDTVTRPTSGMLSAMTSAPVGDDVLGDDPTVIELEELATELTGLDASLFVCSGTMGNQISLRVHTRPGDEVIVESDSHIFQYEAGGASWNSGVQLKTIPGVFGVMDLGHLESSIRHYDVHYPLTSLICLENTHNNAGGIVIPFDYIQSVYNLTRNYNLKLHMDGARIFNASTASGISVKDYCKYTDSIMFCLSKGLCSPVGSIISGSTEFIHSARRVRKVFGGGWRQAGYLAACGIISLKEMTGRLTEDHANAGRFSELLKDIEQIEHDSSRVQSNMVYFKVKGMDLFQFLNALSEKGVLALNHGPEVRVVFHKDIEPGDVEESILKIKEVFSENK